jgi:hypothetical protein
VVNGANELSVPLDYLIDGGNPEDVRSANLPFHTGAPKNNGTSKWSMQV